MKQATPTPKPTRRQIRRAADAIVEFAILSLGPEFLRWDKSVNLGLAEFIWNTSGNAGFDVAGEDSALAKMNECLVKARRTKWKDETYMVLFLDVRRNGDEALFTFELTWDKGRTSYPCEIAWDPVGVSPAQLN